MSLPLTTICYLEKDNQYLMLYRNKKEKDINKGKWIGVGGHVEEGESPLECVKREIKEETGYVLNSVETRGIVTFSYGDYTEYMFVYSSKDFSGEQIVCSEGELKWIPQKDVYSLPMWEGDPILLRLLEKRDDYFSLKLIYNNEGGLLNYEID